jgi:hypothetical protein
MPPFMTGSGRRPRLAAIEQDSQDVSSLPETSTKITRAESIPIPRAQ